MKEQTFEELVNDIHYDITNSFRKDDIIELLKQVREATIKECKESISYNWEEEIGLNYFEQRYNLNKLPTDRIKTEL